MKKPLSSLILTLTAAVALAQTGQAFAEARISAQSIIVNPISSNLSVSVFNRSQQ